MTTTQPRVTEYVRDQFGPGLVLLGGFFRMCVLTGKALFRLPFQWKEFILQCWFIMRVAILPTMAVSVPVTALFIFTFNILLIQVGAADISGAGAGIAVITQIGPINTVLVIAGAVSTAICADVDAPGLAIGSSARKWSAGKLKRAPDSSTRTAEVCALNNNGKARTAAVRQRSRFMR